MSMELKAPLPSQGSYGAVLNFRNSKNDPAKAKAKPKSEKPYLGYRYVRQPNGRYVQVDLTEKDWIHPEVGDRRVSVEIHTDTITYLRDRLSRFFEQLGLGAVLPDMLLIWTRLNLRPRMRNLQPDITVFPDLPLGTFSNRIPSYEIDPNQLPKLVIEILSDSTAHLDRGPKKQHFERIGIEQLILVDIRTKTYKPRKPLVQGFVLEDGVYIEQQADAHGRIELLNLGLSLGVVNATAYLYDQNGQALPYTKDEMFQEAARANQAETRANQAESKLDLVQNLLAQASVGSPQEQAEAIQQILNRLSAPQGGEGH